MEAPTPRYLVVLCTAGSAERAETIARGVVERGLAACVNTVPDVRSTYRWKGTVVSEAEHLLLIKTDAARYPALARALRELHDYEVPEVLALPVVEGDPAYLAWLASSLDPDGGAAR